MDGRFLSPSLTRLVCGCWLPHRRERNPIRFFFYSSLDDVSRARLELISSQRCALLSLRSSRRGDRVCGRFSKRSLALKRKRERNRCVFRSPNEGKRGRKPPRFLHQEVQKRGKKNESTAKTNISKKERERAFEEKERERERVFFKRKERHFSSFLSLLSLTSPEGGAS